MSTPTSPPPSAHTSRSSRGRRWRALVLGAGLLATSAGSALAYSRGAGEPSPSATPPRDLRAQVESLLDASQGDEQLRRLGPQAVPVLSSLVMDGSAPSTRRARAVASLALVDPTQSAHSIQEVLEDARAPADVRASAAGALARCLGIDAIPSLSARLTDQEDPVREAVALALGRLGGQQVRQALEERLPLEERPLVREALQRGLSLAEP
ncbi:HEAT repeat domain-containing protein [Myxococcus sp. K38C18041901]|uniref:HEAT repeat domain-containing protein n=1 Tax=Myxococcus guangdongensis TaxID=2906760 RepID=UPI0020A75249|nr:HEAT repeat domain-containing protein [Myxococcus guangdongensis]MCP3062510.1 HEAT repeat domain-containing protein [Myxococcus guangdongensis]